MRRHARGALRHGLQRYGRRCAFDQRQRRGGCVEAGARGRGGLADEAGAGGAMAGGSVIPRGDNNGLRDRRALDRLLRCEGVDVGLNNEALDRQRQHSQRSCKRGKTSRPGSKRKAAGAFLAHSRRHHNAHRCYCIARLVGDKRTSVADCEAARKNCSTIKSVGCGNERQLWQYSGKFVPLFDRSFSLVERA